MRAKIIITTVLITLVFTTLFATETIAKETVVKKNVSNNRSIYLVQPGDILQISVWREADMQLEVLVKPDGAFTIPLAGEIIAIDKSVYEIGLEISVKLNQYMPDQAVSVAVKQPLGNIIYIIGKVNKPGPVLMSRPLDIVQALSAAGGLTRFAASGKIKVIRRIKNKQTVFNFDFGDIEDGENLAQNIVLKSGDVIVVP